MRNLFVTPHVMYNNARPKVVDVVYRKTSGHHSNPGSSFNTTSSPPPWRIIPEQAGGGLLLDVGCHALDILEYMVGAPLENVRGDACARGTELVRVRCSRIVPRCYNKKYSGKNKKKSPLTSCVRSCVRHCMPQYGARLPPPHTHFPPLVVSLVRSSNGL